MLFYVILPCLGTISSNEERIRNVVSILVQRPDIGGQTSRSSELNLVIDLRNRSIHVKKILENARHAHDELYHVMFMTIKTFELCSAGVVIP